MCHRRGCKAHCQSNVKTSAAKSRKNAAEDARETVRADDVDARGRDLRQGAGVREPTLTQNAGLSVKVAGESKVTVEG